MCKCLSVVLCCALLAGCGAAWSRSGDWNTGGEKLFTPLFSGTCFDAAAFAWCLASPVLGWSDSYGVPPWGILLTPFAVIDLPFSFVVDLYLIKHDIDYRREERAREATRTEEDREAERQRREAIQQEIRQERERERLMEEALERVLNERQPQPDQSPN
ncbi:hypothetical protein JXA47_01965 [Candidatus Sumerlaeota bacterium]|nr:hypothetical protein [Candidatus Sumerlaeota bacterium]